MIAVSEKYALEVGSPTPITSERQHEEYLFVLDRLASKANPTREEEKYAEVLMTLIEAYEEEHLRKGRNLFHVGEIRSAEGQILARGRGRFVIIEPQQPKSSAA